MNVEIRINNEVFPVGCNALASLIEAVEDYPENKALFDLLAEHPSSKVRSEIARKTNIGQDTFDALVLSDDTSVIKALLQHLRCHISNNYLNDKLFQRLLDSNNSDILKVLIDEIEDYDVGSHSERADILVKHNDPDIRLALANSCASKELIRRLWNDQDASVREAARHTAD